MLQYKCLRDGTISFNQKGQVEIKNFAFGTVHSNLRRKEKLSPYICVNDNREDVVLSITTKEKEVKTGRKCSETG